MIPLTIDRLEPNENYLVVVKWNSDSSFKFDNEYRFFGKFMRLNIDRKRTKSFDSGLEILLTPSMMYPWIHLDVPHLSYPIKMPFARIEKLHDKL